MGPTYLPQAPGAVLMPPDLGTWAGSWLHCVTGLSLHGGGKYLHLFWAASQIGRFAAWKCVFQQEVLLWAHSREAGLSATPCAVQRAWYCRLNFCWWEQSSLLIHYVTAFISLRQKHYHLHWWLDIFSRHKNQNQHEFCYIEDIYNMILKASAHLRWDKLIKDCIISPWWTVLVKIGCISKLSWS